MVEFDSITLSDGVDLYYQETGSAGDPTIVLLHGFSGNHLSWWQQVPAFEGFRCLAPDQRRFGLSSDRDAGPGVAAFVDDLRELLDAREIDEAAIVGHSMSGWPAVSMATQYPDRVTCLVLSGTPGGLLSPSRHGTLLEEAAGTLPAVDPLDTAERFLSDSITQLNVDSPAEFGDVRPTLDNLPTDASAIIGADIPTMLIAGAADGFMPESAIREVSERLDGAPYEIVDGAGHSVNVERPSTFNRHVSEFLESSVRG